MSKGRSKMVCHLTCVHGARARLRLRVGLKVRVGVKAREVGRRHAS